MESPHRLLQQPLGSFTRSLPVWRHFCVAGKSSTAAPSSALVHGNDCGVCFLPRCNRLVVQLDHFVRDIVWRSHGRPSSLGKFNSREGRITGLARFFGRISFSFYLLHPLTMTLFASAAPTLTTIVNAESTRSSLRPLRSFVRSRQ